ncbi:thermonuclease family protein [Novosphingobium sp. B 225]|uniref:thermonuclease family protein n=1 Tax=Novosphingobium sp. B 225 TaxID=1961849 RepID=UPI001124D7D9|nr:thermonuclease family protein [Novosphingobium sp. B 225]
MPWPRRKSHVLPPHRWQGLSRGARFWRSLKPWLGTAIVVAVCWYLARSWNVPAEPQSIEQVTGRFTRCGPGAAINCVVDGDTIHIGTRRIRVNGIDAPETHPARCAEEARLGEAATGRLLELLQQGPFLLSGPQTIAHDEYGRELRTLSRPRRDGTVQAIADDMVASGFARRYDRGAREPWC